MNIRLAVRVAAFYLAAAVFVFTAAGQQMPSVTSAPAAAQASPYFNVDAATEAYLAQIPPEAKTRSDAYFEGGYWLQFWDFLTACAISLLLLQTRWSAKMRDFAERMTRFRSLQTGIYWIEYLLVSTLIGFPLGIYEGYIREHQYGLATQTFGPWMADQFKNLLVDVVLGGILIIVLFAIVRRLQRTWWIWGAAVTEVFLGIVMVITPVYLTPIFNKVTPLHDPRLTAPILSMARANGIAAKEIYEVDASKQSTRMSANVSGLGKTMRITLNDNLVRRGSPEEVQAIMGHEMGHYVLGHIPQLLLTFLIISVAGFAFLRWGLDWTLRRWGQSWQIRSIGDPAVLPLVVLLGTVFFFVLTPVTNTIVRTQEHEADMYGLNASRQADGFAQAAIHLAEYRKMRPGPVEEWVFFDHPSGYHRIHDAMQWKAENLNY